MKEHIPGATALRFLGYKDAPDEKIADILKQCLSMVSDAAEKRCVWAAYPRSECPIELIGDDIAAHLKGCDTVVLAAATVGAGVDALLSRLRVSDMTAALVADACAGELIEYYLDDIEEEIAGRFPGKYLTWRYSPGYGDMPIESQTDFIRVLKAGRRIGLCETDSHMLTPRKSVTAVIGISDDPIDKKRRGCASCAFADKCIYREKSEHCGY